MLPLEGMFLVPSVSVSTVLSFGKSVNTVPSLRVFTVCVTGSVTVLVFVFVLVLVFVFVLVLVFVLVFVLVLV